jgi:hypothetical protein
MMEKQEGFRINGKLYTEDEVKKLVAHSLKRESDLGELRSKVYRMETQAANHRSLIDKCNTFKSAMVDLIDDEFKRDYD